MCEIITGFTRLQHADMYTLQTALLFASPTFFYFLFTFSFLFSFHKLIQSNLYCIRTQIRPRFLHENGSSRPVSPYLLSPQANQIVCSWARLNTKDAVTCLAFPPWCSSLGFAEISQGFFALGCKVRGVEVIRKVLGTVGSIE